MVVIRNVAVAGASGNLGPHVLKALLQANFKVTVLTRSQRPGAYDNKITVIEVDFNSIESLTSGLHNQDAVVSTVGPAALETQRLLIDAAAAAGVQRFIPSEFGSCTTSPKASNLPLYSTFATIRQHLADKVATGALSYSVLATGGFLEFILMTPAVVDFKNHSVAFIDEGNNRSSATTLASVGTAIAGILNNPSKTENRVVYVSEVILTQRQILEIAKEIKPEISWTFSNVKSSDMLKEGLDALASGGDIAQAIGKILMGTAFGGEEYGSAYDNDDNGVVGITPIDREKLKTLIAERLE